MTKTLLSKDLAGLSDNARQKIEANIALGLAQKVKARRRGQDWHRHQHDEIVEVLVPLQVNGGAGKAGALTQRVETQTQLDRYMVRRAISERQLQAGRRFYSDWYLSGVAGRLGAGGNMIRVDNSRAVSLSDEQINRLAKVRVAINAAGPQLSPILIHVCLCDLAAYLYMKSRGEEPKAGVAVLRLALDALISHYGI